MRQADGISQRLLLATLKQAEKEQKTSGKAPSPAIIDLARWVREMFAGKPTVRVDAQALVLHLDPDKALEALRQAHLDGQAWLQQALEGSPGTGSQNVTCANLASQEPTQDSLVGPGNPEVGWAGGAPRQYGMAPPAKLCSEQEST